VAEFTGFFLLGKLIEFDKTEKIFTTPVRQAGRKTTSQAGLDNWRRTRFFCRDWTISGHVCFRMAGLAEQGRGTAPARHISSAILPRCRHGCSKAETQINIAEREIDELGLRSSGHAATHGGLTCGFISGGHQDQC